MASVSVAALDVVGQSVGRVVGNLDRLLFSFEFNERNGRSERLCVVKVHSLLHPLNDDRAHSCAGRLLGLRVQLFLLMVTMHDLGPLGYSIGNQLLVFLNCGRRDCHRRWLVTAEDAFYSTLESFQKLRLDALVDEYPLRAHTDLARVQERTEGTLHSSFLEVCISAYNSTRLTTELHKNRFQILASLGRNNAADHCGPGEVDLLDSRVLNESRGNLSSIFRSMENNIENSCGKASFT